MPFDKGVMYFVAAVVVASTGLAIVAPTASVATPSRSTKPLHLRNGMTLHLPSSWKVYGKGDYIRIVTGACVSKPKGKYDAEDALGCDSFMVLGPKMIEEGVELRPYTGKEPYHPSTGVMSCPHNDKWGMSHGGAKVKGLRQVGPGHKAQYREWKANCVSTDGGAVKSRFVQREWFLPRDKVLVVDQWNTPGLAGVLKHAL